MHRRADLMSILARRQPRPSFLTNFVASSKVEYLHSNWLIASLTEAPWGQERWWIRRRSVVSFLETEPRGEQIRLLNGGWENGPAMRPSLHSFSMSCETQRGTR